MRPDAMETFTPQGMGGDAVLAEAKKRIGGKVCMIGGFNQNHYFSAQPRKRYGRPYGRTSVTPERVVDTSWPRPTTSSTPTRR